MYLPNLKCKSNHLLLILILGGNQSGWEFIETRVQGFVLKKEKHMTLLNIRKVIETEMVSYQVSCHWTIHTTVCYWIVHPSIKPCKSCHWIRIHVTGSNFMSLDGASFYLTIMCKIGFACLYDSYGSWHLYICHYLKWFLVSWSSFALYLFLKGTLCGVVRSLTEWWYDSDPMTWSLIQWHDGHYSLVEYDSMTWLLWSW